MLGFRPLPAVLAAALLSLAVIAPLSVEGPRRADAVPPTRVAAAALGSRLTVVGLVGDVRLFPDGGAAAPVSDCLGGSAAIYFPPGVRRPRSWTVALVEGSVQLYGGDRELVAESSSGALADGEGAMQVTAKDVAADPGRFACRPVEFTAVVLAVAVTDAPPALELTVEAGGGTLPCVVHLDEVPVVQLAPGARVTLVGVPAVGGDRVPTVHVRA